MKKNLLRFHPFVLERLRGAETVLIRNKPGWCAVWRFPNGGGDLADSRVRRAAFTTSVTYVGILSVMGCREPSGPTAKERGIFNLSPPLTRTRTHISRLCCFIP